MTHPTITALREAMAARGISDAGLTFQVIEEEIGYPGGTYCNRQIVVNGADCYDLMLTMKNPEITAELIGKRKEWRAAEAAYRESVRKAGEGMER